MLQITEGVSNDLELDFADDVAASFDVGTVSRPDMRVSQVIALADSCCRV